MFSFLLKQLSKTYKVRFLTCFVSLKSKVVIRVLGYVNTGAQHKCDQDDIVGVLGGQQLYVRYSLDFDDISQLCNFVLVADVILYLTWVYVIASDEYGIVLNATE